MFYINTLDSKIITTSFATSTTSPPHLHIVYPSRHVVAHSLHRPSTIEPTLESTVPVKRSSSRGNMEDDTHSAITVLQSGSPLYVHRITLTVPIQPNPPRVNADQSHQYSQTMGIVGDHRSCRDWPHLEGCLSNRGRLLQPARLSWDFQKDHISPQFQSLL